MAQLEAVEDSHGEGGDLDAINRVLVQIWEDAGNPGPLPELGPDDNLFDLGVVDSFSMLEVVTVVEQLTGEEIDFYDVDPEELFTLGGIVRYIDAQRARA